ncbi:MAG: hypothetical protein R3C03_01075 [Pirellulaceae bacterium]
MIFNNAKLARINCVLALLVLVSTGCQSVHWSKGDFEKKNWLNQPVKKKKKVSDDPQVPAHFVAVWKEGVLRAPDGGYARGFGGRFYFYNQENEPIKVDGDVYIYGFDDSFEGIELKTPDQKYVFHQEDLQGHYSETDLGHSYSFWIPWDQEHNVNKRVSLVPVFKSSTGAVINSDKSIVSLPGSKSATLAKVGRDTLKEDGHFIKYASKSSSKTPANRENDIVYQGEESDQAPTSLRTTTIDFPAGSRFEVTRQTIHTVPPMHFNHIQDALAAMESKANDDLPDANRISNSFQEQQDVRQTQLMQAEANASKTFDQFATKHVEEDKSQGHAASTPSNDSVEDEMPTRKKPVFGARTVEIIERRRVTQRSYCGLTFSG